LSIKSNFKIPVFIVHWNRPQECLTTVNYFLSQDIPLRVIVIDNGSELENVKTLQNNLSPNIELTRLEENKGWGGGFNVVLSRWIAEENTPYCFISAHDALPQNQCLNMLIDSMEKDPELGIACPEYGIAELPRYSPIRGPRLVSTAPRAHGIIELVEFAHATLLIARRDCIKQIDGFDERYFAYGDEYDISLKARKYGWKVALVWGAVVVNPGSWTPKPKVSYLFARNTLLLAFNHGGWLKAQSRALLMVLNTFRITVFSLGRNKNLYPVARLLGVRDFWLKRYGKPPL